MASKGELGERRLLILALSNSGKLHGADRIEAIRDLRKDGLDWPEIKSLYPRLLMPVLSEHGETRSVALPSGEPILWQFRERVNTTG